MLDWLNYWIYFFLLFRNSYFDLSNDNIPIILAHCCTHWPFVMFPKWITLKLMMRRRRDENKWKFVTEILDFVSKKFYIVTFAPFITIEFMLFFFWFFFSNIFWARMGTFGNRANNMEFQHSCLTTSLNGSKSRSRHNMVFFLFLQIVTHSRHNMIV